MDRRYTPTALTISRKPATWRDATEQQRSTSLSRKALKTSPG